MYFSAVDWILSYIFLFGLFFIFSSVKLSEDYKSERPGFSVLMIILMTCFFIFSGFILDFFRVYEINNVDWIKLGLIISCFIFSAFVSVFYAIMTVPSGQKFSNFSGKCLWGLAVAAQIITMFEYSSKDMVWRPIFSGLIATLFASISTALLVNVYLIKKNKPKID